MAVCGSHTYGMLFSTAFCSSHFAAPTGQLYGWPLGFLALQATRGRAAARLCPEHLSDAAGIKRFLGLPLSCPAGALGCAVSYMRNLIFSRMYVRVRVCSNKSKSARAEYRARSALPLATKGTQEAGLGFVEAKPLFETRSQ